MWVWSLILLSDIEIPSKFCHVSSTNPAPSAASCAWLTLRKAWLWVDWNPHFRTQKTRVQWEKYDSFVIIREPQGWISIFVVVLCPNWIYPTYLCPRVHMYIQRKGVINRYQRNHQTSSASSQSPSSASSPSLSSPSSASSPSSSSSSSCSSVVINCY